MKNIFSIILLCMVAAGLQAQTIQYHISFENAVHHEAEVQAIFPQLEPGLFSVRMGRSSPGRYAIHEFAKNVYNFKATDSQGKALAVERPNPYQWDISGHQGEVHISYTLYADRGDGTYAQVDETHAHLNIPATFMYAPALGEREIQVDFKLPEGRDWKVATQMEKRSDTQFRAPHFQYFMDSPIEVSNFSVRQLEVEQHGKKQIVEFVLHHNGTEAELDAYFEQVKKIVLVQNDIFGELPDFEYNTYSFLACYLPNASGDGMEHRNSTILTSTQGLATGGMRGNIGTVSHEFFHAWNVERLRPQSLEPFNYAEANMSGELWFAEGFTSYYTNLTLCRAGIISPTEYVEGLTGTFNYVWNSPGRQFFNPIEMSYQAPFVDAATSVDPVNRENTFISYYSYGTMLGLALDLSLRQDKLNLDDYMKLLWQQFGKEEIPYTIQDLQKSLAQYAGAEFSDQFFNSYIHKSGMPDFAPLLASVGVILKQHTDMPYFGASVGSDALGTSAIQKNTFIGSPAYKAGLDKGDLITAINGKPLPKDQDFMGLVAQYKIGDALKIDFTRYGEPRSATVILGENPAYSLYLMEKEGGKPGKKILKNRKEWLKVD